MNASACNPETSTEPSKLPSGYLHAIDELSPVVAKNKEVSALSHELVERVSKGIKKRTVAHRGSWKALAESADA